MAVAHAPHFKVTRPFFFWSYFMVRGTWQLGFAVAVLFIAGCQSSPCDMIQKSGWTCNLNVVEAVQPGDFVYIKGGMVQKLAGSAEGFKPATQPTSIADATGNNNWTFGIDAEVPIPHTAITDPIKASLKANGSDKYSLTFTNSTVSSLAPAADQSPIDSYAKAKTRAQQYLDVLTIRNTAAKAKGDADGGQVWLVTQVLDTAVDYQFTGSSGFTPDVSVPLKAATVSVSGSSVDDSTRSIKFSDPLPIAYRSLLLAVETPQLQGTPSVKIVGNDYDQLPAKHH